MANSETTRLVLASSSPRRKTLLEQIGLSFTVCPVDIDENWRDSDNDVESYIRRMAQEKATAGLALVAADSVVLAADTAGDLHGQLLVKPRDRADAIAMLEAMAGNTHKVITAVTVMTREHLETVVSTSEVSFRAIERLEIEQYCDSGEPFDKAGAYGIQGKGAVFVDKIAGSYSGIVGLPLCETASLLARFGITCWN